MTCFLENRFGGVAANAPIKVKLAALVFSVLGFLYNLSLGSSMLVRRSTAIFETYSVLLKCT